LYGFILISFQFQFIRGPVDGRSVLVVDLISSIATSIASMAMSAISLRCSESAFHLMVAMIRRADLMCCNALDLRRDVVLVVAI